MLNKIKVLFVCVHNSARSQMAEELLKKFGGDKFEVESAGLEPGQINPLVVEVMKDFNIDLSNKKIQSVFELFKQGKTYDYVITVCDEASGEKCPIFPGNANRLHWSFPDPSNLEGSYDEKLKKVREIRDEILKKIKSFIELFS